MSDYQAIREECCEANRALGKSGLVDLTFGNVSVSDPDQRVFAIKPSGVDYQELTPGQIVVLNYEGRKLFGDLRASSDTPTHRCLFLSFPGVRSVVHTHSRCAVGFAQAGRDLPCLGPTHADYFYGPVPVTREMTRHEGSEDYEWNTGRVIVERFIKWHGRTPRDPIAAENTSMTWLVNPLEVPGVLVRNHGPFAWGTSAAKAFEAALALEIVADMAVRTLTVNPDAPAAPEHLLSRHFLRKHGPDAYYGQITK
jgi:L-ribulose-5-phosphate 4-epimerase